MAVVPCPRSCLMMSLPSLTRVALGPIVSRCRYHDPRRAPSARSHVTVACGARRARMGATAGVLIPGFPDGRHHHLGTGGEAIAWGRVRVAGCDPAEDRGGF